MEARELLDLYSAHFENNPQRRPDTALSVESLQWLNIHGLPDVRERLGVIENLADLGTGISSAFFRLWMIRNQLLPGVVWSVETDEAWLQRTAFETGQLLSGVEVPVGWEETVEGYWLLWDRFEAMIGDGIEEESFQVVFLDTAPAFRRPRLLGVCNEILAPGGLLVLDDWHMEVQRGEPSRRILEGAGYDFQVLGLETLDTYGRYMAVAWKPEDGAEIPPVED